MNAYNRVFSAKVENDGVTRRNFPFDFVTVTEAIATVSRQEPTIATNSCDRRIIGLLTYQCRRLQGWFTLYSRPKQVHKVIVMTWLKRVSSVSTTERERYSFPLFLAVYTVLLGLTFVILWTIEHLSIRTYAVIAFVLLLVSSEIFVPDSSKAAWWRWLQLAKVIGWLVLAYIVYERIVAVT